MRIPTRNACPVRQIQHCAVIFVTTPTTLRLRATGALGRVSKDVLSEVHYFPLTERKLEEGGTIYSLLDPGLQLVIHDFVLLAEKPDGFVYECMSVQSSRSE
jgi:hypothetical protein